VPKVVAGDSSAVENLADTSQRHASDSRQPPTNIAGPSYDDLLRRDRASFSPPQQQDPNAGVFQDAAETPSTNAAHSNLNQTQLSTGNKLKKSKTLDTVNAAESSTTSTLNSRRRAEKQKKEADREKTLDNMNVFRNPPTTPSLLPAYRYCRSDNIVKPYRTHHCRACGTVSLTLLELKSHS
jgi:palmitoyltransferase